MQTIPHIYVFGAGGRGKRTVEWLKNAGLPLCSVLVSRTSSNRTHLCNVPVVNLSEFTVAEKESICLVAMDELDMKAEVYPELSTRGFDYIVPVYGTGI